MKKIIFCLILLSSTYIQPMDPKKHSPEAYEAEHRKWEERAKKLCEADIKRNEKQGEKRKFWNKKYLKINAKKAHYYNDTDLHEAALNGTVEEIQTLLNKQQVNINALTCLNGFTALHLIINRYYGLPLYIQIPIIKLLLQHKANVHVKNNYGQTPFHLLVAKNKLDEENQYQNVTITQMLLAAGSNINTTDINKYTPLHSAINPADINKYIPLHHPLYHTFNKKKHIPDIHLIKFLLKNGADVCANIKGEKGHTPLDWALGNNNMKVFKILLPYYQTPAAITALKYTLKAIQGLPEQEEYHELITKHLNKLNVQEAPLINKK